MGLALGYEGITPETLKYMGAGESTPESFP